MSTIQITVSSTANKGKSAVALLIATALREHGIEVSLVDDGGIGIVDELPGVIELTLEARLKGIAAAGTTVNVNTVNMHRAGVFRTVERAP